MATKQANFRVPSELLERLAETARNEGKSKAEVVLEALNMRLRPQESGPKESRAPVELPKPQAEVDYRAEVERDLLGDDSDPNDPEARAREIAAREGIPLSLARRLAASPE